MHAHARMLALALTLVGLGSTATTAHAQRLGGVSRAVHGDGGGGSSSDDDHGSSHGSSSRGYGYGGHGVYGGSGGGSILGPAWVPLFFPYYLGQSGSYVTEDPSDAERSYAPPDVIGIVDASAGYVFDSVGRGQISGLLRIGGIFDVQLRYGAYFEQTADQIRALGIGRLAAAFALVTTDAVQLRIGGAGLLYHDAAGTELGGAGGVELDVYPAAPLVLRGELYAGALGHAVVIDGRATIGVQIERGELYLGYQVLAVDPDASGTVLHGPIAGIRIWIS